jgi:hypothetical protein
LNFYIVFESFGNIRGFFCIIFTEIKIGIDKKRKKGYNEFNNLEL